MFQYSIEKIKPQINNGNSINLKQENFALLRGQTQNVHVYNSTLTEFLRANPDQYTHFILLDHQDWLAWHHPQALAEEWRAILENSAPGSKILMRSAAYQVDYLPDWVESTLRFFPQLTEQLHLQDRVGTYGSLQFAEIR